MRSSRISAADDRWLMRTGRHSCKCYEYQRLLPPRTSTSVGREGGPSRGDINIPEFCYPAVFMARKPCRHLYTTFRRPRGRARWTPIGIRTASDRSDSAHGVADRDGESPSQRQLPFYLLHSHSECVARHRFAPGTNTTTAHLAPAADRLVADREEVERAVGVARNQNDYSRCRYRSVACSGCDKIESDRPSQPDNC